MFCSSNENIPHHQVHHGNQVHQKHLVLQFFPELNEKKNKYTNKNFIKKIYLLIDHEDQEHQVYPRNQVQYHLKQFSFIYF
jgi:hypothetical protein